MRTIVCSPLGVIWAVLSCAGPRVSPEVEAAPSVGPAADAEAFSVHGLSVSRPRGWSFVVPDASVVADTVVILQGPLGGGDLRPTVEISRRELSAADRRRKPADILRVLTLELKQTFAAADADGQPAEIELAGQPAALLRIHLTETFSDGAEVERAARVYAVVQPGQMWIVRCFGPADGSAEPAFDAIVGSIAFAG